MKKMETGPLAGEFCGEKKETGVLWKKEKEKKGDWSISRRILWGKRRLVH